MNSFWDNITKLFSYFIEPQSYRIQGLTNFFNFLGIKFLVFFHDIVDNMEVRDFNVLRSDAFHGEWSFMWIAKELFHFIPRGFLKLLLNSFTVTFKAEQR